MPDCQPRATGQGMCGATPPVIRRCLAGLIRIIRKPCE